MGSGVLAFVAPAKYEIRLQSAHAFSAGKLRLLLRGGRETANMRWGSDEMREKVRNGGDTIATA